MARGARRFGLWSLVLGIVFALSGCEDDVPTAGGRGGKKKKKKKEDTAEVVEVTKREPLVLTDDDFIESERNRDPFRSYARAFRSRAPEEMQRRVIMPSTAVEEMRLIAIVTGTSRPSAMLVDPMGVGHVVERGDYVGRPKVIQATGSVAMMLNWRVDRIRENELVLTQQDPSDPTRNALTKVLLLSDELAANR